MDQHEGQQAHGFGFRQNTDDLATQVDGDADEISPHNALAGAGRIPFVKDQVDRFEDAIQAIRQLLSGRNLEGNCGLANLRLRANNALGDGGRRGEKGVRDFFRRQLANLTEGQRDLGVG